MKKFIKSVMMCSVTFAAFSLVADTEKVGDYTWTYCINGDKAEIFGTSEYAGSGYWRYNPALSPKPNGAVVVPSFLGGKPVSSIGRYAFASCSGLTSVTIPDSVTNIGARAFCECKGLISVTIPDSVTVIGNYAFDGCIGLTSVMIPDGVTSIGEYTFSDCSGLASMTIPDGVTSIGEFAFSGCSSLASVTIPNSVTNIENYAFNSCSGLMSFAVSEGNLYYSSVNGLLLTKDGKDLVCGVNGDAVIPDGVTSIRPWAFSCYRGLTSVAIPDSVMTIGTYAFDGCTGLTSVAIPNGVTSIEEYTFSSSGLMSVKIPNGIRAIGNYAFYGCRTLASVTIPDSVTHIGKYTFDGCRDLTSVTIPQYVCDGIQGVFPSSYSTITNIVLESSVRTIGENAFCGCYGLEELGVSSCIESIGKDAFLDCRSFARIRFYGDASVPIGKLPYFSCGSVRVASWRSELDGNGYALMEGDGYATPGSVYYAEIVKRVPTSADLEFPYWMTVGDGYYNSIASDGVRTWTDRVSAVYDQAGDIISSNLYSIDIVRFNGEYNESIESSPKAGEYSVNVAFGGVEYCAVTTFRIDKAVYEGNAWCEYFFVNGVQQYIWGEETLYATFGEPFVFQAYNSTDVPCPEIRVSSSWDNYTISYESGSIEGIGPPFNIASVTLTDVGRYDIEVVAPSWSFSDEYADYYMWETSVTFTVVVCPGYLDWLSISLASDNSQTVFTGNEITPGFDSGWGVWSSLDCWEVSDITGFYYESYAVTNAGTYQIAIGVEMDEWGNLIPPSCMLPLPQSMDEKRWVDWFGNYYWDWELDRYVAIPVNYTGVKYVTYTVLPRPVAKEQAVFGLRELHCDGTPQTCSVVITNDYTGAVLVEGTDYDVTYSNNILAGMATATVTCKGNYTGTFSQEFEILPSTNVAEVLGLDKVWNFGGDAEWFAEWYENAHDGVSCMRSGAIGDNQESWIETVVTNTGVVSFWWKASSEAYRDIAYDKLVFTVDGTIPESVPPIGGEVDWTNVTCVVEGDGPHVLRWTYRKDESNNDGKDCAWLDDVQYLREVHVMFADGGATDGSAPDTLVVGEGTEITLPDQVSLVWPKHRFAGWRIDDATLAPGTPYVLGYDDVTFTAVWEEKRVSAPSIEVAGWYDTERTIVKMNCATEGAVIHYTLDGSTPTAESQIYADEFSIAGTVTIKAVAVLEDWFDSDVVSAGSVRAPWTPDECLNASGMAFQLGGSAEWMRDRTVTHDGDTAMRSGGIVDGQTSWIETTVVGAGTLTFWWKVSSEAYKGTIYDCARFTVDGVAAVPDIGGEIDWRCETVEIANGGSHVFRWAYIKDDLNASGSDCAWLDCVTWTEADSLPALDGEATDDDVAAIVAELSDARMSEKIAGTAAYTAFRSWVDGKGLSHSVVRDSPNAWVSYALDAPGLMSKRSALASEDIDIESISPSDVSEGGFDLVVGIGGEEIGEGARLAEALGVEGATKLEESAFSSESLSVTLERTADGKAKATVAPQGMPPTFFIRVKAK